MKQSFIKEIQLTQIKGKRHSFRFSNDKKFGKDDLQKINNLIRSGENFYAVGSVTITKYNVKILYFKTGRIFEIKQMGKDFYFQAKDKYNNIITTYKIVNT